MRLLKFGLGIHAWFELFRYTWPESYMWYLRLNSLWSFHVGSHPFYFLVLYAHPFCCCCWIRFPSLYACSLSGYIEKESWINITYGRYVKYIVYDGWFIWWTELWKSLWTLHETQFSSHFARESNFLERFMKLEFSWTFHEIRICLEFHWQERKPLASVWLA